MKSEFPIEINSLPTLKQAKSFYIPLIISIWKFLIQKFWFPQQSLLFKFSTETKTFNNNQIFVLILLQLD
jgi:hypothetical protein